MRPDGTKKAKTAAADKKLIEDLVSTATEGEKEKQSTTLEKVSASVDVVSKGEQILRVLVGLLPPLLVFCSRFCLFEVLVESIQAQNAHLKSQNDVRLMEGLSPSTKTAMSKRMAEVRMAEMQAQLESLKPKNKKDDFVSLTDRTSLRS